MIIPIPRIATKLKTENRKPPHDTASINGFHKVVAQLVKRGANVAMKDKSGNSPLHWAAVLNRHKAVGALLKGGADIDDKDTQYTDIIVQIRVKV